MKIEKEGPFIKKYKKRMIKALKSINPDFKEKDIEKVIDDLIEEQGQNPECTLDNNYTGENRESTLLSVLDWSIDRKPILAGNMTFYKRQDEAINPVGLMLETKLQDRKATKKRMFQFVDIDKNKYDDLDRLQGNIKKLVNSYYGGSGTPASAFYSVYSGPACTSSAQEAISTAENLFEGFAADNYNFIDTDELFDWIRCVFKDYEDEPLPEWFNLITRPALIERLNDKVINPDDNTESIISDFVYNLNDNEVSFLYYKNNIFEFIKDHEYIQNIFYDIFASVVNLDYVDENSEDWFKDVPDEYKDDFVGKKPKDYNKFVNKMYFMDPNDAPENIIPDLNELRDLMMKYIYVNYMAFDRIYRLRNFKRSVVTVIDTDSNILSLDLFMNLLFNLVVKNDTFNRDHVNNIFIGVNTITYILTEAVKQILYTFSIESNISEEFRRKFAMKNEFFFLRLVIGDTKKRYLSRITLREGNYLNPPKYDIKSLVSINSVNCWETIKLSAA